MNFQIVINFSVITKKREQKKEIISNTMDNMPLSVKCLFEMLQVALDREIPNQCFTESALSVIYFRTMNPQFYRSDKMLQEIGI